MKIIPCNSYEELSTKGKEILVRKLNEIIQKKGKALIALPGGRSVVGIFKELKKSDLDWSKIHIFMVDERMVSFDDTDSNYKQLHELLLKRINTNSYPFIVEKGIKEYNKQFQQQGAHFDIVVLGVGEDGHIAALFPDHPLLNKKEKTYFSLNNSPKLPSRRITASPAIIKDADMVILLFVSEAKKQAFQKFKVEKVTYKECPAKIALGAKDAYALKDF